ncbi:MAG: hypothetical protein JXR32_05745, partial [Anaerolineaceae bacterium]|nr:hypothetical protein [Anaerolineaceae bacterium]
MSLPTAPELSTSPERLGGQAPGDSVVTLDNATVCYRVPRERYRTLKEFAIRRVQGRVTFE